MSVDFFSSFPGNSNSQLQFHTFHTDHRIWATPLTSKCGISPPGICADKNSSSEGGGGQVITINFLHSGVCQGLSTISHLPPDVLHDLSSIIIVPDPPEYLPTSNKRTHHFLSIQIVRAPADQDVCTLLFEVFELAIKKLLARFVIAIGNLWSFVWVQNSVSESRMKGQHLLI